MYSVCVQDECLFSAQQTHTQNSNIKLFGNKWMYLLAVDTSWTLDKKSCLSKVHAGLASIKGHFYLFDLETTNAFGTLVKRNERRKATRKHPLGPLASASSKLLHVNQCFFLVPLSDRKVFISSIKKLVMELNQKKLKPNSSLKRCFLLYSIQKSYLGQILLKLCGNIYVPVLGQITDRL